MIVADSSSIISLAMNCMLPVFRFFDTKIVVTVGIYNEIVTHPWETKRFALESLRIKNLFRDNIITIDEADQKITDRILDVSNSMFSIGGKNLTIIHKAEAEAMALIKKTGADALLIDERTTRMLLEKPEALEKFLEHRNQKDVVMDRNKLKELDEVLPRVPVIRSTEVAAMAFERKMSCMNFEGDKKEILKAILYALKFSGCSITRHEIDEYAKLVNYG